MRGRMNFWRIGKGGVGVDFDAAKQRREMRNVDGMGGIRGVTGRLALRSYLSYAC